MNRLLMMLAENAPLSWPIRYVAQGATPVCDPPPSPGPPLAGSPASLAGLGPGGASSWRATPASSLAYSSPHPYGGGVNALHCATALHLCALLVLGPMLAEHVRGPPIAIHGWGIWKCAGRQQARRDRRSDAEWEGGLFLGPSYKCWSCTRMFRSIL